MSGVWRDFFFFFFHTTYTFLSYFPSTYTCLLPLYLYIFILLYYYTTIFLYPYNFFFFLYFCIFSIISSFFFLYQFFYIIYLHIPYLLLFLYLLIYFTNISPSICKPLLYPFSVPFIYIYYIFLTISFSLYFLPYLSILYYYYHIALFLYYYHLLLFLFSSVHILNCTCQCIGVQPWLTCMAAKSELAEGKPAYEAGGNVRSRPRRGVRKTSVASGENAGRSTKSIIELSRQKSK